MADQEEDQQGKTEHWFLVEEYFGENEDIENPEDYAELKDEVDDKLSVAPS